MSASRDGREPLRSVRDRIQVGVVGRERELGLVLAAVAAGRDILLEGPPGTSKSTLLRAITAEWGIPLVFVEGNADLTPAKLIGHHNPARVLREDYSPENFVDGPLVEAMRGGGFLYIEEFNRAPEDTLNTLLTAMAERRIAVPRVGEVVARDTFRVIASMNPYDNIGTTRLSTSVHDRLCRLAITYQDAAAERGIVTLRAPRFEQVLADLKPARYERLVADAVAVTRATRVHEDIRQGSSVRGAIDLTLIAGQLFNLAPERFRLSAPSAHDPQFQAGTANRDTDNPAMDAPTAARSSTAGQDTGGSAVDWLETVNPTTGPSSTGRSGGGGPSTGGPGTSWLDMGGAVAGGEAAGASSTGGAGTGGPGAGGPGAGGQGTAGMGAVEPDAGGQGTDVELAYREIIYDAMVVALSGRIFLDETIDATPEQVLRQIWEEHFILGPAAAAPG
jgi:MoxR-like ATPase